jgi:hypothetical protein
MWAITRARRSLIAALTVAFSAVIATGVTMATGDVRSASSEISACYAKRSGDLRVRSNGTKCRPRERPLTWSRVGPPGVSGLELLEGPERIAPPRDPNQFPSGFASSSVKCSPGKQIVSGGFRLGGGIDDLGEDLRVIISGPNGSAAWQVTVRNESARSAHIFRAYAICALAN